MTTEIAIGRKTGKSAILAYKAVNQKFSFLGYIASAVPILIFPYYCVIGGWIVKYMTVYFTGQAHAAAADDYFSNFISGTAQPIVFLAIFLFCTALVVLIGVQKGVEKVSKILMPFLSPSSGNMHAGNGNLCIDFGWCNGWFCLLHQAELL